MRKEVNPETLARRASAKQIAREKVKAQRLDAEQLRRVACPVRQKNLIKGIRLWPACKLATRWNSDIAHDVVKRDRAA
jgi:hypothetical protein